MRKLWEAAATAVLLLASSAASGQFIAYFPLPIDCQPPFPCTPDFSLSGISAGPGDSLWFTEVDLTSNYEPPSHVWIGRMTTNGELTRWPVDLSRSVSQIAKGPDGNMWFTGQVLAGKIGFLGRITPEGAMTEFELPEPGFQPANLIGGPDGRIWFTEYNASGSTIVWRVGAVTPSGEFQEFPLAGEAGDITAGPDGNLWVNQASALTRITPSGSISRFPLPTESVYPGGITTGPDGNLWFTLVETGEIGRMTLTGAVRVFEGEIGRFPGKIVAGTDSALWFTRGEAGFIGRISLAGEVTDVGVHGQSIAAGPDGNIWFTGRGAIGRISSGSGLLLQQARFSVTVTFLRKNGERESAHPVPQTGDTGAFWFFAPANLELMVKVLDGRPVNGHFWLFYGALSNVGYEITVTDVITGAEKKYENQAGTLASVADTTAFQ